MIDQATGQPRGWVLAAIFFVLVSALVISMSSRGTLISGFVNSAIRINSEFSAAEIVENVLGRARSGDPDAAAIALEIAARQREGN